MAVLSDKFSIGTYGMIDIGVIINSVWTVDNKYSKETLKCIWGKDNKNVDFLKWFYDSMRFVWSCGFQQKLKSLCRRIRILFYTLDYKKSWAPKKYDPWMMRLKCLKGSGCVDI